MLAVGLNKGSGMQWTACVKPLPRLSVPFLVGVTKYLLISNLNDAASDNTSIWAVVFWTYFGW